jgi:putative methyltransferase (TIGR04325 family)
VERSRGIPALQFRRDFREGDGVRSQGKKWRTSILEGLVIFDEIQYSWPLLAALLWIIARENGHLSICDFGGGLGTSYFQNRKFLDDFPSVRWNGVEQGGFVERGRKLIQNERLRFHPTVEGCLRECPCNVVLLSGVLQYLQEPHKSVCDLANSGFHSHPKLAMC